MIAGPNGSGKTTITDYLIGQKYPMGYVLNPDKIEKGVASSKSFDFGKYKVKPYEDKLRDAIHKSCETGILKKYKDKKSLQHFHIMRNRLFLKKSKIDSYLASFLTEYLRQLLIESKQSFTIETVMSHPSKIDELRKAKSRGYRNYLYFVATVSPEINESRVKARVKKKGHAVDPKKIKSRYYRSMKLLFAASQECEKVYFIDNSGEAPELIAQKKKNNVEILSGNVPAWFIKYYFELAI